MNLLFKSYCIFGLILMMSCVDLVEDGITVDYGPSQASLRVDPIDFEKGATNEIVSYQIEVSSDFDIKSCIVQATVVGKNGSGFNVNSTDFDDPFADHIYGTVRKGIRAFKVKYDYIIPEGISRSRLTFTIIDESGKISLERTVEVVPLLSKYEGINLFAQDASFFDAFAAVDGSIFPDIKSNFSVLSEETLTAQEKMDMAFIYDKEEKRATLASPASSRVDLALQVKNNTLFKRLPQTEFDIDDITPAAFISLTEAAEITTDGSSQIDHLKVGDIVGFVTDLNARYSLKTGIVVVRGLHPSSIPRYEGTSYVLECDVIVQK